MAVGSMQRFSSYGGIGRDGRVSSSFYIYFCVRRIRSVKDLGICVIENMLIFVGCFFSTVLLNIDFSN